MIWLALLAPPALAQGLAEADALNAQLVQLYQQGKFAEATEVAKRALAIREQVLGPESPQVATSLNNLALLYKVQGRAPDAEPLYKRSIAIVEKVSRS